FGHTSPVLHLAEYAILGAQQLQCELRLAAVRGLVGHRKRKRILEIDSGDRSRLRVANARGKEQRQYCESLQQTMHGASPSRQAAQGPHRAFVQSEFAPDWDFCRIFLVSCENLLCVPEEKTQRRRLSEPSWSVAVLRYSRERCVFLRLSISPAVLYQPRKPVGRRNRNRWKRLSGVAKDLDIPSDLSAGNRGSQKSTE